MFFQLFKKQKKSGHLKKLIGRGTVHKKSGLSRQNRDLATLHSQDISHFRFGMIEYIFSRV